MTAPFSHPGELETIASDESATRAVSDLLDRIRGRSPKRVADLQLGPRSIRVFLSGRFPDAQIVALDETRAEHANEDEFDLIVWNGDLERLPSLPTLLPALVKGLSRGGTLAVQIPDNLYEPNRVLLRMVAADGPWARTLLPIAKTRPFNETMEDLYGLLSPVCSSVDIWQTTYLHVLNGVGTIVDLMMAASLAPFLRALDECWRKQFLDRFVTELARAYPIQPDGRILLRFPRVFVLARR
jgi:trans-aconitate 2-methyltransferase